MAKTPKVIAKRSLMEVSKQLIGRQYKLGGNGRKDHEPFDCFGLVVEYTRLRYRVDPCELSDLYDYETYTEIYEEDRSTALAMFRKFLDEVYLSPKPKFRLAGDIIICNASGEDSVSIYAGNQSIIVTTPERGCHVMNTYHYDIESAYRWPKQSL